MSVSTSQCAPHRLDLQRSVGSCLTHRELKVIAHAYNSENRDVIQKVEFATKKRLYEALSSKFKKLCDSHGEPCWVQHLDSQEVAKLKDENFKPVKPGSCYDNKHEWLNTYDILLVMRQYEKKDKDFRFVGVFPRDFASKHDGVNCVSREMCTTDVSRGKKKLGFVFNHDAHNEQGSHWVALFCSFDPTSKLYGTHYYDSVAKAPKQEIAAFMSRLKGQALSQQQQTNHKYAFQVGFNKTRHQFKNTECGMFAMTFLINCLEKTDASSYQDVTSCIGNDAAVNALRDSLYMHNFRLSTSSPPTNKGGGRISRRGKTIGGSV